MRTVFKRVGIALAVLIVIGAGVVFYMVSAGAERLSASYDVAVDPAEIPSDSASVAYGRYLSTVLGCTDCHGSALSGKVMADAPPFLAVASNLTSGEGGIGGSYRDIDWLRSIRHGIGPDGRGLFIMPSAQYYYLSDEEVGSLVAYLKTLDPVDRDLPKSEFRTLGKFIAGRSADLKLEPDMMMDAPRLEMPEPGPTAEWGEYRASTLCTYCHGPNLQGQQPPDPASPPAPDLRVAAGWELDQFARALRTGETPSGRTLDGEFMPIAATRVLTDTEIEALFRYLQRL